MPTRLARRASSFRAVSGSSANTEAERALIEERETPVNLVWGLDPVRLAGE
jgi:hypothetical protein